MFFFWVFRFFGVLIGVRVWEFRVLRVVFRCKKALGTSEGFDETGTS